MRKAILVAVAVMIMIVCFKSQSIAFPIEPGFMGAIGSYTTEEPDYFCRELKCSFEDPRKQIECLKKRIRCLQKSIISLQRRNDSYRYSLQAEIGRRNRLERWLLDNR